MKLQNFSIFVMCLFINIYHNNFILRLALESHCVTISIVAQRLLFSMSCLLPYCQGSLNTMAVFFPFFLCPSLA